MRYASLCAGIEAASVAWHPLGWSPVFFSEIDRFPCELLNHHYPNVPNYGDMTNFKEWTDAKFDVLIGGTPCQSFSIVGLRKGLDDPRGNLMLTYLAIVDKYRPKWIVWENVPGVLSSNTGRDFATFLKGLAELGYGFAYRILDAQYFGVPQRRRRVFVVGCLGDWRSAATVLFEQHSLQGHTAPRRKEGEEIAGTITRGFGDRGLDVDQIAGGGYKIVGALCARDYKGLDSRDLSKDIPVFSMITANTGSNGLGVSEDIAPTLDRSNGFAVAHAFKVRGGCEGGGKDYLGQDDQAFTLSTGTDQNLFHKMRVRRLTPLECERLQGFPDYYTKINDKTADSHRYKALGNSMAVPVIKWLGQRIEMVDNLHKELA